MDKLILHLKQCGVLRSETIAKALAAVDRADFVPEKLRDIAYEDEALPIGYGQTISQPYTVVFMLELLAVVPGQCVADVGYGSGWQTALLAHLVGEEGIIYAFEIVSELCAFGKENVAKFLDLFSRATFSCKSAKDGIAQMQQQPDRIIAAAELREVPAAWRDRLAPGGIMVYPKEGSIYREVKHPDGTWKKDAYPGFAFVPFIG